MSYTCKSLEWFLAGENRFLLHTIKDNVISGYAGGFISRYNGDGSSSGMLQYAMAEAFKGITRKPWLLFDRELFRFYPLIFRNIYSRFIHKKAKEPNMIKPKPDQKMGLVIIGVAPAFQGTGIFEALMTAFEAEALNRDINTLILSVKKINERAINAYKKVGFSIHKEHPESLEMIKIITG